MKEVEGETFVEEEPADNQQQNLQTYTPSSLIKPAQLEVKLFNNLYTQTAGFDQNGSRVNSATRASFFGSFLQATYGVHPKFNLGIDINFRIRDDDPATTSDFALLSLENDGQSRLGVSKVGPRVKFSPIKSLERLSIQATLLFPTMKDLEGKIDQSNIWLDWDAFTWVNQVFYDKRLSSKFQLFSALEFYTHFPRDSYNEKVLFITPVKAFLSYFPTRKITVYSMAEFGPTWGGGGISSYYSQVGVGGKYQVSSFFELEVLFSVFPAGKNQGAGRTYNLGMRYLR